MIGSAGAADRELGGGWTAHCRALAPAVVGREDRLMEWLEVRLLGGFQVLRDGDLVPQEAWQHRRGAELVKVLALAREHRLHREQVIEAL